MKRYRIRFLPQAEKDIQKHEIAGDKQTLKKIDILLEELKIHPRKGEGKPKYITYKGKKLWARKITDKHRLLYKIKDNIVTVLIIQAWGHYDDK